MGNYLYHVPIKSWFKILYGRSYWNAARWEGFNFQPGTLHDYYRDYSPKVYWEGAKDQSGLPLVREVGGPLFYHPLILIQKALGHWSHWIASEKKDEGVKPKVS
jgi:hypothetical protein